MTITAENVDVEYKSIYVPELRKDVIAFANTEGGTIYIGIADDGKTIGVENTDDIMLRVSVSLRDSIAPDIMPFVQIRAIEMEGKTVVVVQVVTGSAKPYYLKDKGLKPSGVYVRRGTSSQPVSEDGIRDMIVQSYGKSYEICRSLNQDLTFNVLHKAMDTCQLDHGPAQMHTLKMIGEDGLYNNLALLLSDQCEHTLKVAIFQGTDDVVFRDHQEFSGSLLKQLEDSFSFLDRNIPVMSTIDGLRRNDKRDYPMPALREALLNAILHRDYSFTGSTLVNVYENRIEIISLGGLVQGLTMEAVMLGVSQSRNTNLANVFFRLKLVESYGTGIKRIKALYRHEVHQPLFETATGAFKTTIFNVNAPNQSVMLPASYNPNAEKKIILNLATQKGSITRKEVEAALSIGGTKAHKLISEMCQEGTLRIRKAGNRTSYIPATSDK